MALVEQTEPVKIRPGCLPKIYLGRALQGINSLYFLLSIDFLAYTSSLGAPELNDWLSVTDK